MKKLVISVIFLLAAGAITISVVRNWNEIKLIPGDTDSSSRTSPDNSLPQQVLNQNGIGVWQDLISTYSLAIFSDPLQLFYQQTPTQSLEDILASQEAKLVANAGFYYKQKEKFIHSGLLMIKGQQIAPLNSMEVTQISHVVYWQDKKLAVLAATAASTKLAAWQTSKANAFQTGPLLINNGKVQTTFINQANNAKAPNTRTILGQLLSGEQFIWIQKLPKTLPELVEQISTHPQLVGKIDLAINLDGGSSTSIAIKDATKLNFLASKMLPSLLFLK